MGSDETPLVRNVFRERNAGGTVASLQDGLIRVVECEARRLGEASTEGVVTEHMAERGFSYENMSAQGAQSKDLPVGSKGKEHKMHQENATPQYFCPTCKAKCESSHVEMMNKVFEPQIQRGVQPLCSKHQKAKEYYCKSSTCNQAICADCFFLSDEHKNHTVVGYSDFKKELQAAREKCVEDLAQGRLELETAACKVEREQQSLSASEPAETEKVVRYFRGLTLRVVGAVERRQAALLENISAAAARKHAALRAQAAGLEHVIARFRSAEDALSSRASESTPLHNTNTNTNTDTDTDTNTNTNTAGSEAPDSSDSTALLCFTDAGALVEEGRLLGREPVAQGCIEVAFDDSEDDVDRILMDFVVRRGAVSTRTVKMTACSAAGKGLVKAFSGQEAEFQVEVVTVDDAMPEREGEEI